MCKAFVSGAVHGGRAKWHVSDVCEPNDYSYSTMGFHVVVIDVRMTMAPLFVFLSLE